MWDLLPSGRQLGGAPANFAYHAHALGAEARVISRVGNDALGREAIATLAARGMATGSVAVDEARPTGTVSVLVGPDGQPQYQIHENVAWDALCADAAARQAVADADAICFGSLGQRSEPARSSIRSLLAAAPSQALRIFDVNLRQHYFSRELIEASLRLSNVLKVNDAELPILAEMLRLPGETRAQIGEFARVYRLRLVACTRGDRGSLLFSQGQWSDHAGHRAAVADTVGAGDAFAAAMAVGFLAGWPLDLINDRANKVAAYVCSQPGATPELPKALCAEFHTA